MARLHNLANTQAVPEVSCLISPLDYSCARAATARSWYAVAAIEASSTAGEHARAPVAMSADVRLRRAINKARTVDSSTSHVALLDASVVGVVAPQTVWANQLT